MDFQFYPTPSSLRVKAWSLFQNRDFVKILEPSAGEGDLLIRKIEEIESELGEDAHLLSDVPRNRKFNYSKSARDIDTIEIDVTKHPILREKGFNVVGVDFMKFEAGSFYTHVVMNPPFAYGVEHTLHAWDITYDCEIVSIINAESIRNPHTKERQKLCALIEAHGSVEFIADAFIDAERTTAVEIALIYLRKESDYAVDIVGDIWKNLKSGEMDNLADNAFSQQALAIPRNYIENLVFAFKASNVALKENMFAKFRFSHYASMLGQTMESVRSDTSNHIVGLKPEEMQKEYAEAYDGLKNRAWTSILHSTEVRDRMSRASLMKLEAEFDTIKKLDFTVENVYGFLIGLISRQSEIQDEMLLEFFDSITRWHSENAVHYCGYKSNDKHRIGMKVKASRFIMPNNRSWGSISYDAKQKLQDYDRVMAMLDGKVKPEFGLFDAFTDKETEKELENGERVSTDYFDVRFYKVGTIHFYPKRKDLMDRLNRRAGALRAWLPETASEADEQFWEHYERSEKTDTAVREAVRKLKNSSYDDPWWHLARGPVEGEAKYNRVVDTIYSTVEGEMLKLGIDIHKQITKTEQPKDAIQIGQLLLVA